MVLSRAGNNYRWPLTLFPEGDFAREYTIYKVLPAAYSILFTSDSFFYFMYIYVYIYDESRRCTRLKKKKTKKGGIGEKKNYTAYIERETIDTRVFRKTRYDHALQMKLDKDI